MNFAVVDSGEAVAVGKGTQSQNFLTLSEEAYFGTDLMANLYETLVSSEWHDQNRKLDDGWFLVSSRTDFFYEEIFLSFLLALYLF